MGPVGGGTFRVAVPDPGAIVPFETSDRSGLLIVDALFDSLTTLDDEQRVVAAAATRWYPDASAQTWTFELREGATFHDGSDVTAADFAYAWNRAVVGGLTGYHLRDVRGYDAVVADSAERLSGVEVLDSHTLRVRLTTPQADFPAIVGHPSLGPVPQDLWDRDSATQRLRPVGNGPFAMTEDWAKGQFIRAARFAGWPNRPRDAMPRSATAVDEVVFRVLDPDSAYLAFQQGRIDFTTVPAGALEDAEEAYGVSPLSDRGVGVLLPDEPTVYELGFNTAVPPYDNPEVRRAISLAVDRVALAAATLDGTVRPARALVPPALAGSGWRTCQSCEHDPQAARELFAELGVTELELWYSEGGGHRRVAEWVRADLAAVGVRLDLRGAPFDEFLAAVRGGEAGMFRWGWSADYATLDNVLYPLFRTDASDNVFGYGDPDVDRLLEHARASHDPDTRRERYREAEDLVLNRDQVVVPLFTYRHRIVVSERVRGLVLDPFGRPDWSGLSLRDPAATPE